MQKTNSANVFLDASKLNNPKKRFPTISKKCAKFGIDISKDLIPVAPAAHYFMGGIKTDLNGETSVKNLYAIGEVASTGLHGANRLASNSLLECVVSAYNTAKYLKSDSNQKTITEFENSNNSDIKEINIDKSAVCGYKTKLKDIMWQNVGIFRDEKSLNQALTEIERMEYEFDNEGYCTCIEGYELRNMFITSKLVIKSALCRKESRGAHYRTDYIQTDKIAKHSEVSKEKGEIYFVD
jgi:L-aspartate oxidase